MIIGIEKYIVINAIGYKIRKSIVDSIILAHPFFYFDYTLGVFL